MEIIGRREERETLARLAQSRFPEFLVVYGRRRVGKTFLVREHFQDRFTFHLTGTLDAPKQEQLAEFDRAVTQFGHQAYPKSRSWGAAFQTLRRIIEADPRMEKKVVFLDELPWMATPKSGFLEALGHFWNDWGSAQTNLLLIACGSATSWMVDHLLKSAGGLHGRVTATIGLQPFTLGECEELLTSRGVVMNRYQQVECHMIFGGIPHYLCLLQPSLGLAQNVDRLCFDPSGTLRHEFDNLYRTLFRHADAHIGVVRALSEKARGLTRQELAAATGRAGGGLSKTLADLVASGFVRQYNGFGKTERDAMFQLVDFFTLFYLRFMDDKGQTDPHFWTNSVGTPAHAAWTGYAFEQVALTHVEQIRKRLGIQGVLTKFASWSGAADGQRAQIDLILDRADATVTLCEMKYANAEFTVTADYARQLVRKRSVFAAQTGAPKSLTMALVTTYGLQQGRHAGEFQSVVTMDDLFAPA